MCMEQVEQVINGFFTLEIQSKHATQDVPMWPLTLFIAIRVMNLQRIGMSLYGKLECRMNVKYIPGVVSSEAWSEPDEHWPS